MPDSTESATAVSQQQSDEAPLHFVIHMQSAEQLPVKVAAEDSNEVPEPCFIRVLVRKPKSSGSSSQEEEDNTSSHEVHSQASSVPLTKRDISHVALKHRFDIALPDIESSIVAQNKVLHNEYDLIEVLVLKGDDTQVEATAENTLARSYLNFSQLLQHDSHKGTLRMTNKNPQADAKSSKKKGKKAPVEADDDFPQECILTYALHLTSAETGAKCALLPKETLSTSNVVSFRLDAIHHAPWDKLVPQASSSSSSEELREMIESHLFLYRAQFELKLMENDGETEVTVEGALENGRLDTSPSEEGQVPLHISFPSDSLEFFVNEASLLNIESLLFNNEPTPIRVIFSRVLNPDVVTDSSWVDFNEEKYRGDATISLADFLSPGRVDMCIQSLRVNPIPQEPKQDEGKKKGGPKLPKGLPQELAPEAEEDSIDAHPYNSSQTAFSNLTIELKCPLMPLAKDHIMKENHHLRMSDLVKNSRLKTPPVQLKKQKETATQSYKRILSNVIKELVQQYQKSSRKNKKDRSGTDEERFIFDLNNTGSFFSIKSVLKKAVTRIVQEEFSSLQSELQSGDEAKIAQKRQELSNEVYVYLVENMHEVLNGLKGEQAQSEKQNDTEVQMSILKRLAQESEFAQQFKTASKYYLKRIHTAFDSEHENMHALWYEFALFQFRVHNEAQAEYALQQCLQSNPSYIPALLSYSLLLLHQQKLDESRVLLHSIIALNENVLECWTTLSILYEEMDLDDEENDALRQVKRILHEQNPGTSVTPFSMYLSTAEFVLFTLELDTIAEKLLLKLGTSSRAGESGSKSSTLLNNLSQANQSFVLHAKMFSIRQDYQRAEDSIKQCLESQSGNALSWRILGDLHFEQGRWEDAKQCYEMSISVGATMGKSNGNGNRKMTYASNSNASKSSDESNSNNETQADATPVFSPLQDNFMLNDATLYLRLGNLYLSLQDSESAKPIFMHATQLWNASLSWMGLGESHFSLSELDHAEVAFNEANVLNNENLDVWAWLAVLNAIRSNTSSCTRCIIEKNRVHMRNERDSQAIRGDHQGTSGKLKKIFDLAEERSKNGSQGSRDELHEFVQVLAQCARSS